MREQNRKRLLMTIAVAGGAAAVAWLALARDATETSESATAKVSISAQFAEESAGDEARLFSEPAAAPARSPAHFHVGESNVVAAAYDLARSNPKEAAARLLSLAPSSERDAALVHSAAQWTATDAQGARGWALALQPGGLRETIVGAVATAWADKDPRAAADLVATQMADGVAQRNAAVAVAQRWVQVEPELAIEWVSQFPDNDLRRDAMDALFRIWWSTNPTGVAKWLEQAGTASSPGLREIVAAVTAEKSATASGSADGSR